jgi:hypothetical protein
VLERKRRWPSSVCSPENIYTVRIALQRSPSKSTRKTAARSVQRMLKSHFNLFSYKMTVLPELKVQNKHHRMTFADWAKNNEVLFTMFGFLIRHTSTWMYVCMYVEGVGQKSGPCTATFNDLLCFPYSTWMV